jgi:hypothetical protein
MFRDQQEPTRFGPPHALARFTLETGCRPAGTVSTRFPHVLISAPIPSRRHTPAHPSPPRYPSLAARLWLVTVTQWRLLEQAAHECMRPLWISCATPPTRTRLGGPQMGIRLSWRDNGRRSRVGEWGLNGTWRRRWHRSCRRPPRSSPCAAPPTRICCDDAGRDVRL